jgi:hypothetical protein
MLFGLSECTALFKRHHACIEACLAGASGKLNDHRSQASEETYDEYAMGANLVCGPAALASGAIGQQDEKLRKVDFPT